MHTYTARIIEEIAVHPNRKHLRVGIYRIENNAEVQLGEYIRQYPSLLNTFCPFQKDGKDYALYSPHYTVTRVMELPSCKDIGGEEISSGGFCPADFYIPTYIDEEYTNSDGRLRRSRINEPEPKRLQPQITKWVVQDKETGEPREVVNFSRPLTPLLYYPFGFIAGCVWGDDSTWKILYLDLSEVEKGIIKSDARFGYIELPDKLSLKDAINVIDYHYNIYDHSDDDPLCTNISISIQKKFDLSTGKMLDDDLPDDTSD